VKVHSARDVLSKNFGACRRSEGVFVGAKKDLAIPRLRVKPKQCPKRPAMHHTQAVMVIWSENQGVNIVAPYCWIFTPVQMIPSGCGPVQSYWLALDVRKDPKRSREQIVPMSSVGHLRPSYFAAGQSDVRSCSNRRQMRVRLEWSRSAMKRREQVQRNCHCASTSRQKTHQPKQTVRQDFDNV
jgi:hypothetical protein